MTGFGNLLYLFYFRISSLLRKEYKRWYDYSKQIPDSGLKHQALSSLRNKKFHLYGGLVYATHPTVFTANLVSLIVAYQTISDYLDNLCDRAGSFSQRNFRQLHLSMFDALTPETELRNYYLYNDAKNDGGYLVSLINTCRNSIRVLPSYPLIYNRALHLCSLYCDLQSYKHTLAEKRLSLIENWYAHNNRHTQIRWNEFAAATGSTIELFHLFYLASLPDLKQIRLIQTADAYFPWISSLHILLDYLIDLREDELNGDFNFVAHYSSSTEIIDRFQFIILNAREHARKLPDREFHELIIDGLLGFYLSDRKIYNQKEVYRISKTLTAHLSYRNALFSAFHRLALF